MTFEDRLDVQCNRALGHCCPPGLLDPHEHVIIAREDMAYLFVVQRMTFHGWMLGYQHRNVDVFNVLRQVPFSKDGRFGCIFVIGDRIQAGLTRLQLPAGDA